MDDNLLMLLLRSGTRYMPIVEFFDHVTQDLSELSRLEAERIAHAVSEQNHSSFCSGIRQGMIAALENGQAPSESECFKVALAFALKVDKASSQVTKHDIDNVLKMGWSEQTIEDIVGLVAIQNCYNIIATSLGFKGVPGQVFASIAQDTVDKGGYAASFRSFMAAASE